MQADFKLEFNLILLLQMDKEKRYCVKGGPLESKYFLTKSVSIFFHNNQNLYVPKIVSCSAEAVQTDFYLEISVYTYFADTSSVSFILYYTKTSCKQRGIILKTIR
jgi:hypothetical protein